MERDGDARPTAADLRWFGLVLAAAFNVFAAMLYLRLGSGSTPATLAGLGVALGALYYAVPSLRHPMYLSWTFLVRPIGATVSTVLLAVIYFGLFAPVGRVMALFGRDSLARTPDREATTYWSKRPTVHDPARYLRQS